MTITNKAGQKSYQYGMPALSKGGQHCYESPKKELTSRAFEHLIYNLKLYNGI